MSDQQMVYEQQSIKKVLNKKEVPDKIWIDNIEILWQKDRLTEFFPSVDQTLEEKSNSIMRFTLYISIILSLYHGSMRYFIIFILASIFLYVVYVQRPIDKKKEPLENIYEECTKPSLDNPFMNVTMKDYMNIDDYKIVDRPEACDITDPEIKKQADDFFNNNLYRDINDVFGKMNSQRQFYTMPNSTIPNKQDEFAKWLYLSPNTCKEDQTYCLKNEDVRAKRPVFVNPIENPINN